MPYAIIGGEFRE